jgi:hypothetical protein
MLCPAISRQLMYECRALYGSRTCAQMPQKRGLIHVNSVPKRIAAQRLEKNE